MSETEEINERENKYTQRVHDVNNTQEAITIGITIIDCERDCASVYVLLLYR